MCAYIEKDPFKGEAIAKYLHAAGLDEITDQVLGAGTPEPDGLIRSRPAFGGDSRKRLHGMITMEGGQLRVHNPVWWFDLSSDDNQELRFGKATSFNARRLHLPLWRNWLDNGRALVIATAIGEAKGKSRFRMVGDSPFLLGGLIKRLGNGDYAGTIITRDSHPAFEPYHDKAFPCFVPSGLAGEWLADGVTEPVQDLLDHPRLTVGFQVTPVKSYQSAQPQGDTIMVPADDV